MNDLGLVRLFPGDSDFDTQKIQLPILRYLGICNVLHVWHIRVIPTYRVYRLYDYRGTAGILCDQI